MKCLCYEIWNHTLFYEADGNGKAFREKKLLIQFSTIALKVLSGQIWSAWEWYHWIGLEKDINRYRD